MDIIILRLYTSNQKTLQYINNNNKMSAYEQEYPRGTTKIKPITHLPGGGVTTLCDPDSASDMYATTNNYILCILYCTMA